MTTDQKREGLAGLVRHMRGYKATVDHHPRPSASRDAWGLHRARTRKLAARIDEVAEVDHAEV